MIAHDAAIAKLDALGVARLWIGSSQYSGKARERAWLAERVAKETRHQ